MSATRARRLCPTDPTARLCVARFAAPRWSRRPAARFGAGRAGARSDQTGRSEWRRGISQHHRFAGALTPGRYSVQRYGLSRSALMRACTPCCTRHARSGDRDDPQFLGSGGPGSCYPAVPQPRPPRQQKRALVSRRKRHLWFSRCESSQAVKQTYARAADVGHR